MTFEWATAVAFLTKLCPNIDFWADKMIVFFFQKPGRTIKVYPDNESGQNRFDVDRKAVPHGVVEAKFKLHFNLWTKYEISIVNLEIEPTAGASTSIKKKQIDRDVYDSHNPRKPIQTKIPARGTADIIIIGELFNNTSKIANPMEYAVMRIILEISSPLWNGIRIITVYGELELDDKLKIVKLTCTKKLNT